MSCGARPTSSPIWSSCSPSSAATPPSAPPRASRVITRRSSCSARPPWRRGEPMTTNSRTEIGPARRGQLSGAAPVPLEPGRDCPLCPRLADFRKQARAREPGWFNSPVDSFGDGDARLLIVGLAPGMQGANRTGRPFTGDYAGDLLYATLLEYGFAKAAYQARPDDTSSLLLSRITTAVRSLPP